MEQNAPSPSEAPIERFPALERFDFIGAGFVDRVPGVAPSGDREVMLERLNGAHAGARATLGMGQMAFVTAEQTHGNGVAVVEAASANGRRFPGVDGIITAVAEIALGIYVADCCAVYLVDPVRHCIGLVHSGRKGTELGAVPAAIEKMRLHYGSEPADMVAQLSPCIRPPHYETDFAAEIMDQCRAAGLTAVFDSGENTAADLGKYYSYRMELGKTGRMVALLGMRPASVR